MLTNLRPNGDGTTTGWTAVGGTGTHASAIAQDPHSPDNGASYVQAPNVADGQMFVQLGDVPHNFDPDAIVSITIRVAALFVNTPLMTADACDLYLQLVRSDETTVMSAESTACNVTSTAGYVVFERTVALSGSHTLSDWAGARLKLRQDHTAAQTIDTTAQIRVTAAVVVVDYTSSAAVGAVFRSHQRWRRKPQAWARVDMSHPLAQGIRFFIDCRGGAAYDLVKGRPLTRNGAMPPAYDPKFGSLVSHLDTASTDYFEAAEDDFHDITGDITLIARARFTNLSDDRHIVSKDDGTGGGDAQPFWFYVNTSGNMVFHRANAANTDTKRWGSNTITVAANTWVTLGAMQTGGIGPAPVGYINRSLIPGWDVLLGSGTGAAYNSTNGLQVGRDEIGFTAMLGQVSHVIGFARAITEAEYLALEENPWQILVPDTRIYIGAVQAAGGGGTTVSAALASHVYTAQAPQVRARVAPGALAHTYTAPAPKFVGSLRPGSVAHSYAGQVPGIEAGAGLFPPAATHSYVGRAPQVQARVQAAPVTHSYTGRVPQFARTLRPAQVTHSYNAAAPRFVGTIRPGQAVHSYSGGLPQLRARVQPDAVTHTYVGRVPGLQAGLGVFPPAAAHSYTGRVPQVQEQVRPGAASHTYAGQAAQLKARVQSAQVTHSYAAQAAQVRESVKPAAAVHTYTGRAPQLQPRVQPASAAHTYSGRIPGLFSGSTFFAVAAQHSYTAAAPKLQAQVGPPAVVHVYTAIAPMFLVPGPGTTTASDRVASSVTFSDRAFGTLTMSDRQFGTTSTGER